MVRGRRARGPRVPSTSEDVCSASPKRKDCKLEFRGKLSHCISPKTSKDSSRTNYFSPSFQKSQAITSFFNVQAHSITYFTAPNVENVPSNIIDLTSEDDSQDVFGVNSALMKLAEAASAAAMSDASCDSGVVIETDSTSSTGSAVLTSSDDSNNCSDDSNNGSDEILQPTVRTSPRKNPSTLAYARLPPRTPRTPHRIGQYCHQSSQDRSPSANASEDIENKKITSSPTTALSQLRIAFPKRTVARSRRRLQSNHSDNTAVVAPVIPPPQEPLENIATIPPVQQLKKLTDYFPVRRSVRKTKKAVLEERQRDIEKAIINEQEEGLEVHNFAEKGRGIVAVQHFPRGSFVVEYSGDLISIAEAKNREIMYSQDQNTGCYMYYFKYKNKQYCIDATAESGKLGRLVNHSRNGNLLTKTVQIGATPHLVLIAKDDIQPGEEVTYDYGDRSKESLQHHPWLAL